LQPAPLRRALATRRQRVHHRRRWPPSPQGQGRYCVSDDNVTMSRPHRLRRSKADRSSTQASLNNRVPRGRPPPHLGLIQALTAQHGSLLTVRGGLVLGDHLGPVLRGERTTERTRRRIAGTDDATARIGRPMINFVGRGWPAAAHADISCHALQRRRSTGSERGPGMSHSSLMRPAGLDGRLVAAAAGRSALIQPGPF